MSMVEEIRYMHDEENLTTVEIAEALCLDCDYVASVLDK